ncbi:MAG: hypothetical protein EP338_09070 [Bacteroidetes bacterium]|nr:MAG: hypothetical protein EP338_09070 [Bacteroidota bacterium]
MTERTKKRTSLFTWFLILIFFALFLGFPLYSSYGIFCHYQLKKLPVLHWKDFEHQQKGDVLTGIIVLQTKGPLKSPLVTEFEKPMVRHYDRINRQRSVTIPLFHERLQYSFDGFPDRFGYGPRELPMPIFSKDLLKRKLRTYGFIGKDSMTVQLDENKSKDFQFLEYMRQQIGSYDHVYFERGLGVGDTVVGEFVVSQTNPLTIKNKQIYCFEDPKFLFEVFWDDYQMYLLVQIPVAIISVFLFFRMIIYQSRKAMKRKKGHPVGRPQ